jgi:hypothetical protein
MQEEHDGRIRRAGFAVEDGDAVGMDAVDECEWDRGLARHSFSFPVGRTRESDVSIFDDERKKTCSFNFGGRGAHCTAMA